jgi:membrane-associated protein
MSALVGFLDPVTLIEHGGLALLAAIVFAESGLLIGFFLPGDSLLFIAGFLASATSSGTLPPIALVVATVIVAAIAGDQVGFLLGRRAGVSLARRPRTRLFDPRNIERTEQFFERHGPKTIVLARFVPIVRTFAPIVAGVGSMRYRTFTTYNIAGAVMWGGGVTMAGYYLGDIDLVRRHVELATMTVVALSLIPVTIEVARHRRAARLATARVGTSP